MSRPAPFFEPCLCVDAPTGRNAVASRMTSSPLSGDTARTSPHRGVSYNGRAARKDVQYGQHAVAVAKPCSAASHLGVAGIESRPCLHSMAPRLIAGEAEHNRRPCAGERESLIVNATGEPPSIAPILTGVRWPKYGLYMAQIPHPSRDADRGRISMRGNPCS